MQLSKHYVQAKRLERAARRVLIMRAAIAQASPAEQAALDAILARAEAITARIARERQEQRTAQATPPPAPTGPIIINSTAEAAQAVEALKRRKDAA